MMSASKWYYAVNRQQEGPVTDIAVRSLIRDGIIQPETLLWRDGMSDWQKASETEFGSDFHQEEEYTQTPIIDTVLSPTSFTAQSLYRLWLWFASLACASLPLFYLVSTSLKLSKPTIIGIMLTFAVIISVIGYLLLYRLWTLIQDGEARTTPGKAVGFCLIPLYNIYWNYTAYVGLAADLNKYCDKYGIEFRRVDERLALIWYVLSVSMLIPVIGQFVSIAVVVTQIVMMKQFVDVAEKIIEKKESHKKIN